FPPVAGPVEEPHRVGLDGDPALALQIHGVEHLIDGFLRVHGAGECEEPVGQGRFPVIDVRDDGEVSDAGERGRGHRAQSSMGMWGLPGPWRLDPSRPWCLNRSEMETKPMSLTAPIGILDEHPEWSSRLSAELESRRLPFERIDHSNHAFDPRD